MRRLLAGDRAGSPASSSRSRPARGWPTSRYARRVPLLIGTWRPRAAAFAGDGRGRGEDRRLREPRHGAADARVARAGRAAHRRRRRHGRRRGRRRRAPPGGGGGARCTSTWSAGSTRRSSWHPAQPVPIEKFVLAGTPDEVARARDCADRGRGVPSRVRHAARADDGRGCRAPLRPRAARGAERRLSGRYDRSLVDDSSHSNLRGSRSRARAGSAKGTGSSASSRAGSPRSSSC